VRIWKPETKAVDSGFLKPKTLKEISIPPGISFVARLVTVRTELAKEQRMPD
jgi:hypothetical protein